ncbi:MAG: efflux transporter outer membrane subunit [Azospirillaceae bacterium]|nr:efflux transporter outer membrane subunit [Azospirillaceae bacterium]
MMFFPPSETRRRGLRSVVIVALALGGCTVGPDYQGPPDAAPIAADAAGFHRAAMAPVTASPPPARWWEALNDPLLTRLIDTALANSPTIRQVGARVREARATVVERRAGLFPQGSASALARTGMPSSIETILYDTGFDASWELDLFGAARRGVENARAQAGAQEARLADAQIQLAAEVSQTYVNLRDAQRRTALLRLSGEIEQHMLDLTRQRRTFGTASQADVERLDTQINQTLAAIAPLQAQTDQYLDEIATLLALEPGQLDVALTQPATVPLPPATVPVGDPAAMLRRRPDIREAERQLAASNAQIGQAVAQFFPTVSLVGTLGFASTQTNHLFDSDSFDYLGGPTLSWNIFNFGRTEARVREARAGNEAALAQYQNTVLSALQDAETALSRFGHQRENVARLAAAEASAARGAELTRQRQAAGTASLIDSLDTERQRTQTEQALVQAEALLTNDYISLQKALGLGWSPSDVPTMAQQSDARSNEMEN